MKETTTENELFSISVTVSDVLDITYKHYPISRAMQAVPGLARGVNSLVIFSEMTGEIVFEIHNSTGLDFGV